jgi:hypothetical protein
MKVRTVYFKVAELAPIVGFWQAFLQTAPHKNLDDWVEFRCQDVNFAFLLLEGFSVAKDAANFVPVFEVAQNELKATKIRAMELGATHVIDVPDGIGYVLADPLGNEFEIACFHD